MPYNDAAAQRAFQRDWMRQRRVEYLADKTCEVCGGNDRLELHHRDPSQKLAHVVWSWNTGRREAELAKCEVLCQRCHQRIHQRVRLILATQRNPCGTNASYHRGCRCFACTEAHARREREQLQRKAARAAESA